MKLHSLAGIALLGIAFCAGAVRAQPEALACADVGAQGTLTIEGVGVALFNTLNSDRARDALQLGGGVCIELDSVKGELRASEVTVVDFSTGPMLMAASASLTIEGWLIEAEALVVRERTASLENLSLQGERAVGFAQRMQFALDQGMLMFEGLRFATEVGWVDARFAWFQGAELELVDVLATTCDCPPRSADLFIKGSEARFNLETLALTVVDGTLNGAAGAVNLPNPWTLSGRELILALPVSFGRDFGVQVRVDNRTLAPGAVWSWSLQSGALEESTRPLGAAFSVDIRAREPGSALRWQVSPERFGLTVQQTLPISEAVSFEFRQRLEGGSFTRPVREIFLGASHAGSRHVGALGVERLAWELFALQGMASEGEGSASVWDAPLKTAAALRTEFMPMGPARLAVALDAGDTRYLLESTHASVVALTPSLDVRVTPWRLRASHLARFTWGVSPFVYDRVDPLQRTNITVAREAIAVGSATLTPEVAAEWQWPPLAAAQLRLLRVRLDARGALAGDLWSVRVDTNMARWVAPLDGGSSGFDIAVRLQRQTFEVQSRARFDPFTPGASAQFDFAGTWSVEGFELGWDVVLKGTRERVDWSLVNVSLAAPIRMGSVSVRPLLEVDVLSLATQSGSGAWLTGHGVLFSWTGCCGTLDFGYRQSQRNGFSLELGARLPTYPLDLEAVLATRGLAVQER